MKTIRFTRADLDLFRSASHDRNPLHLSDEYTRRSPYGGRVVFGVLNGLMALGHSTAADRAGNVLSRVEFEFFDTALLDIDYRMETVSTSGSEATVRVTDGRRPVLEALFTFAPGKLPQSPQLPPWQPDSSEPEDLSTVQLPVGKRVAGKYSPSNHLEAVCSRVELKQVSATTQHVAALMWASYLIGMKLPGKRALFSRLLMDFQDVSRATMPFDYQAEIADVSEAGELTIRAALTSGGTKWATVTLGAYVREDLPEVTTAGVESLVGRSQALQGKVALVTGASRGLGSALVRVLALHGCTVLLNFVRSQREAEQLRDSLSGTPGKVYFEVGDVSSLAWCKEAEKRISTQWGRLDFLICNASPPLLPLWLEASNADRVNDFIQKSLAMLSSPMMAFLPLLAGGRGWNVLISSTAVNQPHPYFPHYVVAKCGAEAMVRAASAEYRAISSLIVRPQRLLTDLTNTPLGRKGAMPPEKVAAAVLKRVLAPPCPGKVEILEQFSAT
jgi:NAD(P)-dependent dehydrogenase (short-subunit alcohol dehydrogenase family)